MGPFGTHTGSSSQLPLLSTPPPASPLTKTKYLLCLRNGGRCGFLLLLTLPLPRIRAVMGNIYSLLRAGPCSKGFLSIWSFHFYNPTKVRVIIISVLQRGPWRRESKMTQLKRQHIRTQAQDRLRNSTLSHTTSSWHFSGSLSAWTTPAQSSAFFDTRSRTPSECSQT